MEKALYICSNPFNPVTGVSQRSNLICRALAKLIFVDVITFSNNKEKPICNIKNCSHLYHFFIPRKKNYLVHKFVCFFRAFFFTRIPYFRDKRYSQIVKELIANSNYRIIITRFIEPVILFDIPTNDKLIIDIDDLPEQVYQTQIDAINDKDFYHKTKKMYYFVLKKAAKKHVDRILKNSRYGLLPNKSQVINSKLKYLPNIPYPFNNNVSLSERNVLKIEKFLFVGALSWWPNTLGLNHFLEKVWGVIVNKHSDISLTITGPSAGTKEKKYWESFKNVTVSGFLEHIGNAYHACDAVIVPLYNGAGTNIKVLEALYYEKLCIATDYACKGFDDVLIDQYNIFKVKDDADFIKKLEILILNNIDKYKCITENAKKTIASYFSFDFFCECVKSAIQSNEIYHESSPEY
jgi:glycosyltransferase involved in cell wall biosynthesis